MKNDLIPFPPSFWCLIIVILWPLFPLNCLKRGSVEECGTSIAFHWTSWRPQTPHICMLKLPAQMPMGQVRCRKTMLAVWWNLNAKEDAIAICLWTSGPLNAVSAIGFLSCGPNAAALASKKSFFSICSSGMFSLGRCFFGLDLLQFLKMINAW